MNLYQAIIKPILFQIDPENAHSLVLKSGAVLRSGAMPQFLQRLLTRSLLPSTRQAPVVVNGLKFPNRLGLAAGCDKNCSSLELFAALGFGHIELGTVTPRPQIGNPRPRIFRISCDQAIINRMGFPSAGMVAVKENLQSSREQINKLFGQAAPIVGVNVGKQKETPLEEAYRDYCQVIGELKDLADYFTVNISSPNTPELRRLQEGEKLRALLTAVREATPTRTPLYVKVAPDLDLEQIDQISECIKGTQISGVVATNTTLWRPSGDQRYTESGGLSGAPLCPVATPVIERFCQQGQGKFTVIGVGGITSGEDARRYLDFGAQLVQLYSGLVFRGPQIVKDILRSLN